MKYYDYEWDCDPNGIILDEEFDADKLGWKGGDLFKLININGRCRLVKIDELEKFLREGKNARKINEKE